MNNLKLMSQIDNTNQNIFEVRCLLNVCIDATKECFDLTHLCTTLTIAENRLGSIEENINNIQKSLEEE